MISIVMSTYNGSKYITEQLESIRNQTINPDEVIILDDCSTDDTYRIVKEYISEYSLKNWRLQKNEENIGWRKSFYKGLYLANGEFIFLCDQDDVWYREKLEIMSNCMKKNRNISLLASGYEVFYDGKDIPRISKKLTYRMKSSGSIIKCEFSTRFMYVIRPGCTYAVRKSFINLIKEYWDTEVAHDAVLYRWASILDCAYYLEVNLIRWRRHSESNSCLNNVLGNGFTKSEKIYNMKCKQVEERLRFLINMREKLDELKVNTSYKKIIDDNILFEQEHQRVLLEKKPYKIITLYSKYSRFFLSYRTAIGDFLTLLNY